MTAPIGTGHSRARLFVFATLLCLVAGVPGAPATAAVAKTAATQPASAMWTRYWQVRVRAAPGGKILTELDRNQEVRVIAGAVVSGGTRWDRVQLWGTLEGWIQASLLAAAPLPVSFTGGETTTPNPVGPHAPMTLHAEARAAQSAAVRRSPESTAPVVRTLAAGTALTITRWATDARGRAWYGVTAPVSGWLDADQATVLPDRPAADTSAVHGIGMWLTPPVLDVASPQSIVAAAVKNHVTHLYVEIGASKGFYGQKTLDRLLPVAHKAHIAVLAWVYPYLDDVPLDVEVAVAAARYVAPTGDRPDGLAADVEQNMAEPYVRAYGQILRARLGPQVLMIIAVYPPQTYWGLRFPFPAAALSWDVFAPMDYWNTSSHAYTEQQAYDYVAESIAGIRTATGDPAVPIEAVGQMYDAFGNGKHSPTLAEVHGAIRAAVDKRSAGISFFEWNHATPEEWDALRTSYHFG